MLGGLGPLFLFGFFGKPFVMVMYAMAVGAKHNAFFNFFHGAFKSAVLD